MGGTEAVLFDIDTQRDFCDADGSMYVHGADAPSFRANLAALVAWARAHGHHHVAAADAHPPDEPDFSDAPDMHATYPPHCIVGTRGADRVPQTRQRSAAVFPAGGPQPVGVVLGAAGTGEFLLEKRASDVFTNPATTPLLRRLAPRTVVVMGVATDYCVAGAVDGLLREHPGTRVVLALDACAGVFPARVRAHLDRWAAAGVDLLPTARILAGEASPLAAAASTAA